MELVEDDSVTSLAAILLRVHSRKDQVVQKELIHEWERSAAVSFLFEQNRKKRQNKKKKFKGERKRGRIYALSAVYREDGTAYKICRNAFMKFFGIDRSAMKTIENSVSAGNVVPSLHKLSGKESNAGMNDEMKNALTIFFNGMVLMAEPHASKVVRLQTKLVLKDDDSDIELPSNFTKRGMYERWCLDRGWIAKAKGGRCSYGKLKEFKNVSPTSTPLPICTM
jgi:hypothetical protein